MKNTSYFIAAVLLALGAVAAGLLGSLLPDGWRMTTTIIVVVAIAAAGALLAVGLKSGNRSD